MAIERPVTSISNAAPSTTSSAPAVRTSRVRARARSAKNGLSAQREMPSSANNAATATSKFAHDASP